MVSALIYYVEGDWNCSGLVAHLIGVGTLHAGIDLWRNPVIFGESDDDSNDVQAEEFFFYRMVESALEATPFPILQCLVMIKEQGYTTLSLVSTTISFIRT